MRRFYIVIHACLVYALMPIAGSHAGAEPPRFDSLPIADFPSGVTIVSESEAELPLATEELPGLETLLPPKDLPLLKESLDSSGGRPSSGYSQPSSDIHSSSQTPLPFQPAQGSANVVDGELFSSPIDGSTQPYGSSLGNSGVFALPEHDESSAVDIGVQDPGQPYVGDLSTESNYLGDDAGMIHDGATMFGGVPTNLGSTGGWDFGGWLSAGSTYNADGNQTSSGNAPLGFNNFADGLVLNQAWMYLAKETQTCGCGFDWGFRLDFMFGADAPDTQAFGDGSWDASWDTGGEYGFAMPQLYGEVAYNRTKTKFGRFFTNIGYEIVQAPYNFFYSHSLSRYYNQPFTHTGFLTQFSLKPDLTLFGGWSAGWDSGFKNDNDGSTFLGGAVWNVSDRFDIIYSASVGDPGDIRGASSDVYMHSLIGDYKFGYGWNYVMQWDYQTRKTAGGPSTGSNALNQYLFKQLRHDLSVGTRVEYFRDEDGARIGNGPGDYYGATFGVNWRPMNRMMLRPEIRWDWFEGAGLPYDNNTSRGLFTVGMDAVYVF